MDRIRLTLPDVRFSEVETDLRDVIESGWLTNGPRVGAFEADVASYVGAGHGIATSSGTTALHLALSSIGVGEGDEVVVPAYTFPATINAVLHCGGRPVLADVQPDTFNIDIEDLALRITDRTKAIMPVHQFGLAADMAPIADLADLYGLSVIEDAACALGATYRGAPCGSLAAIACFSFHPRKVLTTAEGGMIVTDDEDLADTCRLWRNHGMASTDGARSFVAPGYNFRMDELSAVLGIAQMKRLSSMVSRRRERATRLSDELDDLAWMQTPYEPPDRMHTYQSYVVVLDDAVDRDSLISQLDAAGIEAAPGATAVHTEPYFRERFNVQDDDLPVATDLDGRSLALPLFPRMKDEQLDRLVEALHSVDVEERK